MTGLSSLGGEIAKFESLCPAEGWPTWTLSNHDVPRHATRYDHPELGDMRARVAALLLLTLRGTPFLYYGEEIGMRNVPVAVDRMQDPLARTLHPKLCRDGERSPMCWEPTPGAGFTTSATPWLPLGPQPPGTDVATQRCKIEDDEVERLRAAWREIDADSHEVRWVPRGPTNRSGMLDWFRRHGGRWQLG